MIEKIVRRLFVAVSALVLVGVLVTPAGIVGAEEVAPKSCFGTEPCEEDITVTLGVENIISLELSDYNEQIGENITMMTIEAGEVKTADLTATVMTNSAGGYFLTIQDADEVNALRNNHAGPDADITALTGTDETTGTALVANSGTWGIRGGDLGATDNSWRGIPANGTTLTLRTFTPEDPVSGASEDTVNLTYGVASKGNQAAGLYEDLVVVTATTK